MFRSGGFDKLLDKATSHLLMEPDWPSIIQICDLIRQNDISAKTALAGVKKKLNSPNPHSALYALLCLESMVKNCGVLVAEELTLKANCDYMHELVKTTTHENVRQKLLELIQTWNFAFRKNPKHGNLKDLMAAMKSEGYKFPVLRESDAMFSADTAPDWIDGDSCHRCRVQFTLLQRKHHCRACGQVFCSQCTTKTTTLPKYGIEKEVRVCDTCYDKANKPSSASKSSKEESDLPPEYLKSSLAQQSQNTQMSRETYHSGLPFKENNSGELEQTLKKNNSKLNPILPPAANKTPQLANKRSKKRLGDKSSGLQGPENISTATNTVNSRPHDEFHHFALNIAAQLRQLPLQTALRLQVEFQSKLYMARANQQMTETPEIPSEGSHGLYEVSPLRNIQFDREIVTGDVCKGDESDSSY